MANHKTALGIDIGGSGIKGALVDLEQGDFATDRVRIPTPEKSTPKHVAAVVAQIVEQFADRMSSDTPVGITVPAPVLHGYVPAIANLDKAWKGTQADDLFRDATGHPATVVNDADAAGIAEYFYGAARAKSGLVCLTTLGTGIGSALIHDGVLIPNTEFGHLEIDGHDAESQAAASVREKLGLSYKEWVPRLTRYYSVLEALIYPDLFVVGGGVSRKAEKFLPDVAKKLRTPMVPATLENRAGIIGAARLAADAAH